jgi:uncharacterized protein YbjQ (UPF0145 family)
MVSGSVVYSRNAAIDLGQAVKNLIGGELRSYTRLLESSRQIAADRMCARAAELGADAVVSVRFGTSDVAMGAVEVFAYGTAARTGS